MSARQLVEPVRFPIDGTATDYDGRDTGLWKLAQEGEIARCDGMGIVTNR